MQALRTSQRRRPTGWRTPRMPDGDSNRDGDSEASDNEDGRDEAAASGASAEQAAAMREMADQMRLPSRSPIRLLRAGFSVRSINVLPIVVATNGDVVRRAVNARLAASCSSFRAPWLKACAASANTEAALANVATWQKAEHAAGREGGDLRSLTPAQAVAYLEQRGETVGQKTLDQERQAIQLHAAACHWSPCPGRAPASYQERTTASTRKSRLHAGADLRYQRSAD